MFEWIGKRYKQRRTLDEVAALDERDLADIGLPRETLADLVTTDPAVYDRMDRMAALHGLTHGDLQDDRAGFAALARICEDCAAKGRCQDTLARAGTGVADVGFCPNHEAYRGMAKG